MRKPRPIPGLFSPQSQGFLGSQKGLPLLFWIPVLSGIVILLTILGALQYRWSSEIKRSSEVRVGSDLESLMIQWHLDFYGEFSNLCVALQVGPDSGERDSWDDYLHRYAQWSRSGEREGSVDHLYRNRDLVRDVYIWETSNLTDPKLRKLDPEKKRIENVKPPAYLLSLLGHLQGNSSNLRTALRAWERKDEKEASSKSEELPSTSYSLRSNAEAGWQFDANLPALVHPIFHYTQHRSFDTKALSSSDPVDWMVMVMNFETIQKRILPELVERYFRGSQGLEYKLAVIAEGRAAPVLYSSDPGFGTPIDENSDSVMNIFGPPPDTSRNLLQIERNEASLKGENWHRFSSPVWFPVIQETSKDGPWELILQHRQGRADAAVTRVWRSNLLTGGVVLLLLAASMILVVVASQHAQRLANLQMDFVASVSHELRTPLTVILSAGENVRDGLIDGRRAFMEQGSIITEQANQLMELVDQVLNFAVISKNTARRTAGPLAVSDLVTSALDSTRELLLEAGFSVEVDVPDNVPSVVGDLSALTLSLRNLIVNAVKYSNEERWIRISANLKERQDGSPEVQIRVEDHGVGISSSDLPQIFQPFHRGLYAVTAGIRGTGLGLAIAKRNAETFGGSLSVVSEVGVGSTFTLHLQVHEKNVELQPLASKRDVSST